MYAAAMNQGDALMALLEAGANPYMKDSRNGLTMGDFAAARGHWDLILHVLCYFDDANKKEVVEQYAKKAVVVFLVDYNDLVPRSVSLRQLLAKCGGVNFLFDNHNGQDNTLLFHTRTTSHVEALLENGFQLINHRNSAGRTAWMALNEWDRPETMRKLLEAGADINVRDNLGRPALYYILCHLASYRHAKSEIPELLSIYLTNGADSLSGDKCRCSCSPSGCYPTAPLIHRSTSLYIALVQSFHLAFEWLFILTELRGKVEAQHVLLSFVRAAKHKELGMTHTCCSWESPHIANPAHLRKNRMSPEDIDRVLVKESDLTEELEREMMKVSDWDYESLLDYWIHQINNDLGRVRNESKQMYRSSEEVSPQPIV